MIDFTLLNKYIERPMHSFPLMDQVQHAIRHDTCFMACIDFPSGYFQLKLDKESPVEQYPEHTLRETSMQFVEQTIGEVRLVTAWCVPRVQAPVEVVSNLLLPL